MKKILSSIFLILYFSFIGYGSHASGGFLTYECTGNNTYIVTLTWYRDCSGATPRESYTVDYASSSCSYSGSFDIELQSTTEVNYCPKLTTTCDEGDAPGYQKVVYVSDPLTLPYQCDDWIVSVEINDRNSADWVTGTAMRLLAGINNTNGICNNSVKFSDNGVIFGCLNNPVTFNPGIIDFDGNFLSYELTPPLQSGSTVSYNSGLDYTNPIPNIGDFLYSQTTSSISFTPTAIGVSYMAFKVTEYDNNGNELGWTIRDIQIIIDANCFNPGPVFSGIGSSSSTYSGLNNFYTIDQSENGCFIFYITELEGENITNVEYDISGIPSGFISVTNFNSTGNDYRKVKVCFDEGTYDCFQQDYVLTISAQDDGCPVNGKTTVQYVLRAREGDYCDEFAYYTNRTAANQNLIPAYTKRSNMIYVGDNMPPQSNISQSLMGPVEIYYPVTLEAGVGIDIQACSGSSTCIDFIGTSSDDIHMFIAPNICSPECSNEQLDITSHGEFHCSGEKLVGEASGGLPPYTYNWYIVSDPSSNSNYSQYMGTGEEINVHDHVSQLSCGDPFAPNDGIFWYKLVVSDAAGATGEVVDHVLGTSVFYQQIYINTTYWSLQDIQDAGLQYMQPGNYFGANLGVSPSQPFFLMDGVNNGSSCGPPYYGITNYDLWIFSGEGDLVFHEYQDLDGGSDWSFDNREISWNGHWNDDVNQDCVMPYTAFAYRLLAHNCLAQSQYYEEISGEIEVLSCFNGEESGGIVPAGMTINDSVTLTNNNNEVIKTQGNVTHINSSSRFKNNSNSMFEENFTLQPNPTNGVFYINGNLNTLNKIEIIDISGKILHMSKTPVKSEINISDYSSGIYFIKFFTNNSHFVKKIEKI